MPPNYAFLWLIGLGSLPRGLKKMLIVLADGIEAN